MIAVGWAENLRGMGLSEDAAEVAADGRDGPSPRPVSETSGQSPAAAISRAEGRKRRLISIIERWAADIRGRGDMVVYEGESREEASLRTAYGKVILEADQLNGVWVAEVARERWPWLMRARLGCGLEERVRDVSRSNSSRPKSARRRGPSPLKSGLRLPIAGLQAPRWRAA